MRWTLPVWASLNKWHHALRSIPNKDHVLPESANQLFHAWRGDKILGAAAARAVVETTDIRDSGSATSLVSKALSNQFFASHVETLLPQDICPLYSESSPRYSERQLGSMVEAAVAHVHDSCSAANSDNCQEAVFELAEWLVREANERPTSALITLNNPKGRLLELGGTVGSRRVAGFDHNPMFEAVAEWKQWKSVVRDFGSKKAVERTAAWNVLTRAIESSVENVEILNPTKNAVDDIRFHNSSANDDNDSRISVGPWRTNSLDDWALTLQNDESPREWWHRGAENPKDAYGRAMMAPHLFETIVDIQCWSQLLTNKSERSFAAFVAVLHQHDAESQQLEYFITPVCRGESLNQAKGKAAVQANCQIVQVIGRV